MDFTFGLGCFPLSLAGCLDGSCGCRWNQDHDVLGNIPADYCNNISLAILVFFTVHVTNQAVRSSIYGIVEWAIVEWA